jgi:glycosyltransferase involved in cell wall biosynthesis
MTNNIKCACIIPCFNEEKRIKGIFQEINDLNVENIDWFILDNGSTDNSFQIIEDTKAFFNKKNIYIIRKRVNNGYGSGIKYAVSKIISKNKNLKKGYDSKNLSLNKNYKYNYDILSWTHADGQTPLVDVLKGLKIVNELNSKEFLVKGIRVKRDDGIVATIFTSVLNIIQIIFFSKSIISPNSQPTLVSTELLTKIMHKTADDFLFDLSVFIISSRIGAKIKRFSVKFLNRESGSGANQTIFQKLNFSIKNLVLLWEMRKYSRVYKN